MRSKVIFILSAFTISSMVAADLKNGKAAYNRSCKTCHGADGSPNQSVAQMFHVQMRNLGSADVQALSDDDIKKIIADGKGKMPAVKSITGTALDDVVAYIRTLKK